MQTFEDPALLMSAWADAINRNEPHLLADVFAVDAEFINLFGSVWQGQKAIIHGHAWALGSVLRDSSMQFNRIDQQIIDERVGARDDSPIDGGATRSVRLEGHRGRQRRPASASSVTRRPDSSRFCLSPKRKRGGRACRRKAQVRSTAAPPAKRKPGCRIPLESGGLAARAAETGTLA